MSATGLSELKEITVFCEQGDSSQIRTWSNVPYFFTRTLEAHGVKVNRVNLHPSSNLAHKLFYKLWNVFAKGIFRNKFYTYRRTGVYFWIIERRIRKALKTYPNSDINLFLCYNFTTKRWSKKPVVLFSDWTIDYEMRIFKGTDINSLSWHERKYIDRQRRCIESADCVVCLFPGIAADMRNVYQNPNIFYIGNVVNALEEPDRAMALQRKKEGKEILFVGKKHYLRGAEELLHAFARLRQDMPEARLHIIGMKSGKFKNLPDNVVCHGYLDKGNPQAKQVYYDLLKRCRLFINTTPKWGAFSASVEAMYFYTPVIVEPYGEFVNTFGADLPFGMYHDSEDGIELLEEKIRAMLTSSDFEKQADAAHAAVAEMTWNNFVERFLELLKK